MPKPLIFDARQVPVTRIDAHLPAVSAAHLTSQAVRERFATPPLWQPEIVQERRFLDREIAQAAVLLGLVMREELTVLLTQRTAHLSTHSGQVAFAGGKCDEIDANPSATALREAFEEVGLEAQHVQVLGELPQYKTGSAFHVTPVVALISPEMTIRANPEEVDAVFEVPLSFLMNPAHHRWHSHEFEGVVRQWLSMPYLDGEQERFIWGATAGMIRNFYRFMSA